MDILASWNQRRVERRAERRARAHSDEIDRRLRDELMHRRRFPQHDILLVGSCFPSLFRPLFGLTVSIRQVLLDLKQKRSQWSSI
jgi:hypothetical protein